MVTVAVPKERAPGERRVALVPEVVARLVKGGARVRVERGAGEGAYHPDEAYQEAGAEVVRLKENRGKGGAIAEGLKAVRTPFVLLLDADLLGLRPEHLFALLKPLKEGEARMAVGVFRGGRASTDLAMRLTPFLSGQRALRLEDLRSVPGLERARYDLELLLTRHAKRAGWPVVYVPMEGVSQVMKEEKRGVLAGLGHRLRMYWEILRYRLRAR
jgi:glycosyltransferase involved in cell wall biosynthesis